MPQIEEKFIFSLNKIQSPNDEPNFRIIKHELNTVDEFNEFLTSEHFINVLRRSLYCFLLVIKCINEEIASKVVSDFCETFTCGKQFLIEVVVASTAFARFMYDGVDGSTIEWLSLVDHNLSLSPSVSVIKFSRKSILDYDVKSKDYKDFLKQAVEAKAPLLIRLFKCFDEWDDDLNKRLMENLVSRTCLSSIRSFLHLPLIYDADEKPILSKETVQLLNYEYNKGMTLFMIACEKNNYDAVELLCRLVNINESDYDSRTASDYTRSSNLLILLLENDARFPINFGDQHLSNGNELEKQRITEIVNERSNFHAAIEEGKVEAIQLFREKNPKLMFAYKMCSETSAKSSTQTKSQSVLLTALIKTKDDFKTVNLLLGNGFNWDKEYELNKEMKTEIPKGVLNRLHEEQPSHINFLLSKCKIFPGKGQQELECYNKIKENLNTINDSDVGAILKLIEYSDSLSIIVDFYNKHVTVNPNAGNGFDGYTDHHNGHIYINATGKETFADVLAHECCHLALHILFKNACKPYYDFDDELENVFKEIVDMVHETLTGDKEKGEEEKILLETYECYVNKADWPKELIARVPQLIVMGRTQFLHDNYPKLLDFLNKHVLTLMESHIKKPENFLIKREVEKLNDFLRHFKEIGKRRKEGVWTKCNKFIERGENTKLIECKCVRLYLADIYKTIIELMKRNETPTQLYIVTSVEDFECDERRLQIRRIWDRSADITLIVNCENYNENHLQKLKILKSCTGKFLVVGVDETVKKQIGSRSSCEVIKYTWQDIAEPARDRLFQYPINFQGHAFTVGEITDNNTDVIPLERLVNGKDIVIRRLQPTIDHYDREEFVERKFVDYERVDCVLSLISRQNLLLIDDSGSGKSIVLAHCERILKEKYPAFWVIRKSLRELDHHLSKEMTVETFLKLCVNQTDDKDFQEKLVIEFYKKKTVILLLDAAEEIVQSYGEFLEILEKLNVNVQLFVTSQPHLLEDLRECLPKAAQLKLKPFSKEDQVNCVYKIWKNNKKSSGIAKEKLKKLAEDTVISFVESVDASAENIGVPLITRMLAEIVCIDDFRFKYRYTGIYALFVDFVKRKTKRANVEKKEETVDEFGDNMTKDTNYIYGRLALKYLFRFNSDNRFVYSDDAFEKKLLPIDADDLKRSGLISVTADNKYIFDHDLFAEFLAAVFVMKCLRNKEHINVAVDILLTVSRPTLIRFIDGGFRTFQEKVHKSKKLKALVYNYLKEKEQKRESRNQNQDGNRDEECDQFSEDEKSEDDDEIYRFKYFYSMFSYLKNNAYFTANFLVKSIPWSIRTIVEDGFDRLFEQPQKFFSFFLTAILFTNHESIARTILTKEYEVKWDKRNDIFQHIFLRFPKDKLDAITDNTNINVLTKEMYDPILSTTLPPINERFERSTLKLLVDKANRYHNANERADLLKSRNEAESSWEFNIGEDYFEDSLDMKLMAMKELGYPFTSWCDLMTNTVFEGVILRIFKNSEDNKFIMKFYRWASEKRQDYVTMDGFQTAVSYTFVRYFWECSKNYDASEFLQFIRTEMEIDITALLDIHANEIIPKFTKSLYSAFHISQNYFTSEEFKQLVIKNDVNGVNLVSEYVSRLNTIGILEMVQLLENSELVQSLKGPLNASRSSTLCKWIFSTATKIYRDDSTKYWCVDKMFEIIEKLLDDENLKKALQFKCDEGTVFHAAAKHRDLFMMKIVWHMARKYFSDPELETLLKEENSQKVSIIRDFNIKVLTEPPNIFNISRRAAFEFINWEDLSKYYLNVPFWFHDAAFKSFCIGRLRNPQTNEDELYEIVYNEIEERYESYALIGYDGKPEKTLEIPETSELIEGMKILTGNGFKWVKAWCEIIIDARDYCFTYNNHSHYFSFIEGHISFVRDFSVDQIILLFCDLAIQDDNSECLYCQLSSSSTPSHYSTFPDMSSMIFNNNIASPACTIPSDSDASADGSFDLNMLDHE